MADRDDREKLAEELARIEQRLAELQAAHDALEDTIREFTRLRNTLRRRIAEFERDTS
jgi:prefoldin subunit 5